MNEWKNEWMDEWVRNGWMNVGLNDLGLCVWWINKRWMKYMNELMWLIKEHKVFIDEKKQFDIVM